MARFLEALSTAFLKTLNMSISAGWVILAVLCLRLILKKAPKLVNCLLWGIAALRLIFPVSLESIFSLIPSAETVDYSVNDFRPYVDSGIAPVNNAANGYLNERFFEGVTVPVRRSPANPINIISFIWLLGTVLILVYAAVSFIRLKRKVKFSTPFEHNTYDALICDSVNSPFIFGIFRPVIYLPSSLGAKQCEYVMAHERSHLARRDHLWKPLGFLLLAVHWFNPLCWAGYALFCKDMELACDERVIKSLDFEQRKEYSKTLLELSAGQSALSVCPLAFCEVGVKQRIKSALSYKKPALWIMIAAAVICAMSAVCLLTNPKRGVSLTENSGIVGVTTTSGTAGVVFKFISGNVAGTGSAVYADWINETESSICIPDEFSLFCDGKPLQNSRQHTAEVTVLKPGERFNDTFNLQDYSISQKGSYTLKKEFWFENSPNDKRVAELGFIIGDRFPFVEKVYSVESVVRADTDYELSGIEDMRVAIDDSMFGYLNFYYRGRIDTVNMYYFGVFTQTTVIDGMFAAEKEGWRGGMDGTTLEKNNMYIYCAFNSSDNKRCYLMLQDNGDIYLAYGRREDESAAYLVFKLRETDESIADMNLGKRELGNLRDKMYRAERILYQSESAPVLADSNLPLFGISPAMTFYSVEEPGNNQYYLGELTEISPDIVSMQEELGIPRDFSGFSLEELFKNNERTYRAYSFDGYRYCYVFKQKGGKIYIAYANKLKEPPVMYVFEVKTTGENFYVGSKSDSVPSYYIWRRSESLLDCPCITLDGKGRFTITFSLVSSYISQGSYSIERGGFTLKSDENDYTLAFDFKSDGTSDGYFYNKERSTYNADKFYIDIPDGARFDFYGTDWDMVTRNWN